MEAAGQQQQQVTNIAMQWAPCIPFLCFTMSLPDFSSTLHGMTLIMSPMLQPHCGDTQSAACSAHFQSTPSCPAT
jgi:hypothetical protein